jgi:hypothetical protein
MKGRSRIELIESADLPSAGRVDRANHVIRDVKIIGRHSRHDRTYTRECLEAAAPLYEGIHVYVGHTPSKGRPRKPDEPAIAWLTGVYSRGGELYARQMHVMSSHPLSKNLLEAAERNPKLWCLSHHAHGSYRRTSTGEVIEEIVEVHSVDLVRKGATTKSLFEGHAMKLSEYITALKLSASHRRAVKELLEDDTMYGDAPMPEDAPMPAEDAPAADHTEALKGGFMASISALAQQTLDGTLDEGEGCKKIMKLLKAHGKLAAGGDAASGGEEEVEEMDDTATDDVKESAELKARVAELEAQADVRELCESLSIKPGKTLLAAACKLPADQRRELLEEYAADSRPGKPRTQKPGAGAASSTVAARDINDGKGFAAALRGSAN